MDRCHVAVWLTLRRLLACLLARLFACLCPRSTNTKLAETVVGTPFYMSPELFGARKRNASLCTLFTCPEPVLAYYCFFVEHVPSLSLAYHRFFVVVMLCLSRACLDKPPALRRGEAVQHQNGTPKHHTHNPNQIKCNPISGFKKNTKRFYPHKLRTDIRS